MTIVKLDQQLKNQPQEVRFCTSCVVSSQRPRIGFDPGGVCSACHFRQYERAYIDWKERQEQLEALLANYCNPGGYDVVVPTSGGKDSFYVAHTLKQMGMHPLGACFSPFRYTEIGRKNFQAFINSGIPVIQGHPNPNFHRKLSKLCFEVLGDAWQPFGYGQMAYPHLVAASYGIPLIFYGENGEAQYSGSREVYHLPGMPKSKWMEQYYKGRTVEELVQFGLEHGYFSKQDFVEQDLDFYRPPRMIDNEWPMMHWMSYYKLWDPMENYYLASSKGFTANDERSEGTYTKYASLDDKTDGFHFYMAYIKFGIGRATSDAAHEVRDGQLTREEAVALVKRYDGEFPKRYFPEFLDYLGITKERFWEVVDAWRPAHLWEKVDEGHVGHYWKLKQDVS